MNSMQILGVFFTLSLFKWKRKGMSLLSPIYSFEEISVYLRLCSVDCRGQGRWNFSNVVRSWLMIWLISRSISRRCSVNLPRYSSFSRSKSFEASSNNWAMLFEGFVSVTDRGRSGEDRWSNERRRVITVRGGDVQPHSLTLRTEQPSTLRSDVDLSLGRWWSNCRRDDRFQELSNLFVVVVFIFIGKWKKRMRHFLQRKIRAAKTYTRCAQ